MKAAPKLLLIDNYDSFSYNLVHILEQLGATVEVKRNDAFEMDEVLRHDGIVLSPGPGIPEEAGKMPELIRRFAGRKPILGICLGHQAIAEAFGGKLHNLQSVFHGIAGPIQLCSKHAPLFAGLPDQFLGGRYHSWVVERESLPDCLELTATSPEGHVMAFQHMDFPLHGLQFHPESVLSPCGPSILQNFLELI